MLNSFEIATEVKEEYRYNFKIFDTLFLNYNHEDIFHNAAKNNSKIITYGYCFDVRNPKAEVKETLSDLLINDEELLDNIKYLNGHFIMLFNINGHWRMITDAAGITPIYFDVFEKVVTSNNPGELPLLNGVSILDLHDFTISRIEISNQNDEDIEKMIIDLTTNQYKYFLGKNFTLNFSRNNLNKTIISILHPALFDQTVKLRENDEVTVKLSNWLIRDYRLNVLGEDTEPSTKYLCSTYLMEYSNYINNEIELNEEKLDNSNKIYSLLTKLNYKNEQKAHLIYDPFNVLAIQKLVYDFSHASSSNLSQKIVEELHPAINFYDFSEGVTVMQKYDELKKKNKKMSEELKKLNPNKEFLRETEEHGIKVSDNLDGRVLDKGVTFHPAFQTISKEDTFEITYNKKGSGMVLIESYFNNPKNAHRIKVELNNELFNIDEFFEGKFLKSDLDINIKMSYERNYDAASWQKAGRITVKEID